MASLTRQRYKHGRLAVLRMCLLMAAAACLLWTHAVLGEGRPAMPPKPAGTLELSPCKLPDVTRVARCGALVVAENPDRPAGRQLSIAVAVIPALGPGTHGDPIAVLMGGPGEDAIGAASFYVRQFEPLLHDHDLLLVDQRGTGRSNALRCDLSSADDPAARLRDLFPPAAVERCARELRAHADLTQYTFPRAAGDLEQVRRSLGYGPLNLFGGSYGTRAEQVYLRLYPQSVRTAYFGSAVPVDVATPLAMAGTAQAAAEHMFDACAADAACNKAFPQVREEFRQLFARLQSGPVRVTVPGRAGSFLLYRGRVAEWIRTRLYRPKSAAILPWVIHRAYAGDWSFIAQDLMAPAADDADFSFGLFFAITCNEDIPFLHAADVAAQARNTFLGDDRVREQQAACRYWPKVELPPDYRTPVHSPVPALFVTGAADGGTPLWYSHHAVQGFPDAVEVVVQGQGHTEWNACVDQLYQRLVRSGSVHGLEASKCAPMPWPAFRTN